MGRLLAAVGPAALLALPGSAGATITASSVDTTDGPFFGHDSDGPLKPDAPDVDALGYVPDAASEIATWSAMIIPVRQGAGTRVKIADGFSRKCPIVSTHLGAFGYDVRSGRELLLADKPDDFAAACVSLIRDPTGASAMADRAYAAFLQNWTWDAIAPRVWAAAEDALRLDCPLAAQPA